ncbi:hydrolase [Thermococcus profundus]|uniref:Hydrolase n=1 Tax=Thermococcus profundus TaxID=49899 RepID=A0A2Z2MBV0_THEPR|nr:hydrolase [Thermococcus profundus]ASJ03306.1 hydrolase [Thermococcus profundus]
MKRRGFVFTLDAMLALLLVTLFVTSIAAITSENQVYSTYLRSQSKYVAQDTLMMLRTVPLNQIVPGDVVEQWEKDGTLDLDLVDPNMNPLDIVATYWATEPIYPKKDLRHKAEVILGYILNQTLSGYNYEMLINDYTSPYLRRVGGNYSKAPDVSPATLVMSGYAYNQTPRGYMARAYLTKIGSKENTYTIRGGYVYASTPNSDYPVTVRYIVPANALPSDANVEEIEWFLEPAWVDSHYDVYLNGHWIWSGNVHNNLMVSDQSGVESALKTYFVPGQRNVFEVRVYKSGYDGGEDGAQYIRIRYTTSVPSTLKFPRRFYWEDVSASYGITAWKYFFVPGDLHSLNIQISAGNVSEDDPIQLSFLFDRSIPVDPTSCTYDHDTAIKTCYWDNSTISSTLSAHGYNYKQISSRYTTVIATVGDEDTDYSPKIHLIGEQSFIEADYSVPIVLSQYTVDITEPIALPDQGFTQSFSVSFDVPSGVIPLWVTFQFPWLYYTGSNPYQRITVDNDVISPTYIHDYESDGTGPSPFIYALARIGYTKDTYDAYYQPLKNAIAEGTNIISVSLGNGYYLEPRNGNGELTYAIQAYAGYGDVFPYFIHPGCKGYNITYYWQGDSNPHHILAGDEPYCDVTTDELLQNRTKYAVDDAIIRLFNNLGGNGTLTSPILIELPKSVNIDFASMGNIPGLFQPIQITLRVWRED